MTQHPDLFGAIWCGYPLLDMLRYQKFLVGHWWTTEYGSADNEDQFPYILKYSPYQNVKPGTKYPAIMFFTGDSDTRVDPLHARKMTALDAGRQRQRPPDSPPLPNLQRPQRRRLRHASNYRHSRRTVILVERGGGAIIRRELIPQPNANVWRGHSCPRKARIASNHAFGWSSASALRLRNPGPAASAAKVPA